ncbi:MAG TPA: hypothetical protein PK313_08380, partial [Myxococcota bacterium]|nr:hypothetical protein [Myxococcota bacterium]
DWISRHRFPIVVVALLLLPLPLMFLHGRAGSGSSPAQRASMGIAGVAQRGVGAVVACVVSVLSYYVVLVDLRSENRRLAADNERLVGEALAAKQLAVENAELRR